MTDLNLPCDEPELPELTELRQLSRLETAPAGTRAQVLARAGATLSMAPRRPAMNTRRRSLLLAALVLIGVPSAFAATPFGGRWLGAWFDPTGPAAVTPLPHTETAAPTQPESTSQPRTAERATPVNDAASPSVQPATPQKRRTARAPVPAESRDTEPATPSSAESPTTPSSAALGASRRAFPTPTDQEHRSVNGPEAPTTLEAESRLLRRARLRLAVQDAVGALRLADEHRRRFPNGLLRQERQTIERQAWALGSGSNQN
jgi:hypothetical protein